MSNELNVQQLIGDYNEYILKVPSGSEYIYTAIRNGEVQSIIQSILDFSEGIGWIITLNNYMKTLEIQLGIDEVKLQHILKELNEALEVQDFYLVADLFEYEIIAFFENLPDIKINN